MNEYQRTLKECNGNVSEAARRLGIPRGTFRAKLEQSATAAPKFERHLIIPDVQARPGDDLSFLNCISRYIEEKRPDRVINLGDLADMASLSSYDIGKRQFEGRRYKADVNITKEANERIWEHVTYDPDSDIFEGNHEYRIQKVVDSDARLEGTIGLEDLEYAKYYKNVHPFLSVAKIGGIAYSHYFYNPNSGKPYGGTAHVKLKNIGMSFVMGHQQGLDVAMRELADGRQQIGIVAGSCYEHDETYRGPQANGHWRGIIMLHEVDGTGRADPMFVSLNYLRRKYA